MNNTAPYTDQTDMVDTGIENTIDIDTSPDADIDAYNKNNKTDLYNKLDKVKSTILTIITERHQPLTATLYLPNNTTDNLTHPLANDNDFNSNLEKSNLKDSDLKDTASIKNAIMIAPATGIKRQFYHSFAAYLADMGYAVITYDNEGIGDSLTCPLDKCDASLISWGRHDMTAVLEALQDECPNACYHLIGHSAGGQLVGLMPNFSLLSSIVNIACSSGQIDNMKLPFKVRAKMFMNMAIPLSNLILGYTPSDKFGMGEPLPRGVAKQWRDWCNGAGYIKTAIGKTVFNHYYEKIEAPSLWLNFTDDDIANAKNVDDMTHVFTRLPVDKRMINPKDYGLSYLGHMKYFSSSTYSKAPELWAMATNWINYHSDNSVLPTL